jgi:molybdopterin/thiamine biosynthesis adenylyltransferase
MGCELLKNMVMMGVGAGNGEIIVNDSENVKIFTTEDRFLMYRSNDVGVSQTIV